MNALFDDIKRTDTRAAREREQRYSYLNVSARPAAQLIRDTLESWFADYPDEQKTA